jgi:SAM-dependent methyltransferase
VADLALALALPAGPERRRMRVLDPACGDGVFLARAAAAGVSPAGLCGIELDPAAAEAAAAAVRGSSVRRADLFSLAAGEIDGRGFDAVVGNPPYVRQERLSPAQKRRVERRLARDWPDLTAADRGRLVGRADLAAAVIARALRLCRPRGRVALVVSSALLDAGYGDALWRLVKRHGRVVAIVDAPSERWFRDAAVNAIILVLERSDGEASADASEGGDDVLIARLRVPTDRAAARLRGPDGLADVAELRRAPAGDPSSWAGAVRAPSAWFDLAAAAGDRLVPLDRLAEVRRGVTSGANELFYLSRARAAELDIEPALLAPLLRSPREPGGETIAVDPAALSTLALVLPRGAGELARFPSADRYIAQHADLAARPTLRARPSWWALSARPARLFLTKAYAARFVQRLAPSPVVADQRLYSLHPRAGVDLELFAAVLNSTFTALALESLGRASLGEGALEWTVTDAARLPVLDPGLVPAGARTALAALSRRPIRTVHDERARSDRASLDRAIAGPLAALLPAAHDALCASVSRRAARARAG